MKNRVIVFLISVIMTAVFVSLTAVGVFAQDKLAVSVSSEQVKEDAETVTLDVSIKNNPGIAGVTLSLEFDNTALAVKSVTEGEFSQLSLVPGSGNQSPYKVMLVNFLGADIKGDGRLFSVTFDILEGTKPGTYDVTVSSSNEADGLLIINQNGSVVPYVADGGSVTVVSGNKGDGSSFGGGGETVTDKREENDKTENEAEDKAESEGSVSEEKWTNPFADVKEDDWFYASVEYASNKGLFKGMTETTFGPSELLTRAMLVTVLYRAEGEPETVYGSDFTDVSADAYYAKAVAWAKANGIVNGVTVTEFAPDANITREQIATIIFRYAAFKGMNAVTLEENLHFDDADTISEYAVSALNWAVGTGLMNGRTQAALNPRDNATRAEAATILMRYFEEAAK